MLLEAAEYLQNNERRDRGKFGRLMSKFNLDLSYATLELCHVSCVMKMVHFLAEDVANEHGYASTMPRHVDYPRRRQKQRKTQGNR